MAAPGRPPADRRTDQTRAYADQVEKLQWLYKIEGVSSASFIGPLIESELDAAFDRIRPIVDQIKEREAKIAAISAGDTAPVMHNTIEE